MLITLVTVTYNAEATLERTLKSVEEQSFTDFEHIIMDGASKDGTLAIAQAYKLRNDELDITIVSERDSGLYDAMNKAIRRAKGEFICFLNAGDKLHNAGTLELVAEKTKRNGGVGVVYGDTDIVDDEGSFIRRRRLTPPETLTWKSFRQGMLVCHQAFYANTSIIPEYDRNYRFSADFDWCVRTMKEAKKRGLSLENTHEVLADYLSEGMTTKNHKASLKERFHIMVKHYGFFSTVMHHAWFVLRGIVRK